MVGVDEPAMGGVPCEKGGDEAVGGAIDVFREDDAVWIPLLHINSPGLQGGVGMFDEETPIGVDVGVCFPDHAHDAETGVLLTRGLAGNDFGNVGGFAEHDAGANEAGGDTARIGYVCIYEHARVHVYVCAYIYVRV